MQAKVLPLSAKFVEYGQKVTNALKAAGLRVQLDDSDEKLGYKIRRAELEKVPYALVLGGREQEAGTVGVRKRIEGDLGSMSIEDFAARLQGEVARRER